jgi:CarD family transcriptional regulator
MSFAVGDKVVYPHHGAAIIEGKEKRVFDGHKTDYFVLRITYGDLKVSIPVEKADEIGLREVINDEEVEEVFAVLRKKEARMPTNWSRRFKNHVEKLKSGDIYQVAEVVRNLSLREADKGLSAGEKRMLARARQILVSELTFELNVDEEAAELRLDDVLAGRDVPLPPRRRSKTTARPRKLAAKTTKATVKRAAARKPAKAVSKRAPSKAKKAKPADKKRR